MKTAIIIPARMGSTRFPGKPLANIAGKSLIQRVYQIAMACENKDDVFVATDHADIYDHVTKFGGKALMTPENLATGTDRVAFVAQEYLKDTEIFFNLQGDTPVTPPWIIEPVLQCLKQNSVQMATPAIQLKNEVLAHFLAQKTKGSTSGTTVVFDKNQQALYFSKAVLPFARKGYDDVAVFKHIGLYGYRRDALLKLASLPQTPLEVAEQLEQLRALENGIPIQVVLVDYKGRTPASVDLPEDVQIVEQILAREGEIVS